MLKNEKLENIGNKDELSRQKESNVDLLMKIKFMTQKIQEAELSLENHKIELNGIAQERRFTKK